MGLKKILITKGGSKMEKTRKLLLGLSIGTLVVACIMLVLAVFRLPIFRGVPLRILLCVSTISIACGLALSDLIILKKNKILGIVGLSLLGLSTLLALICFCSNLILVAPTYNRILGICAILSVAYTEALVVYSRLDKYLLWLQIITYFAIALLTGFLVLIILGVPILAQAGMLETLIITCIVCLGSFLSCYFIGAKIKGTDDYATKIDAKIVKIDKAELDKLNQQISSLKEENEKLKEEIQTLKSQKNEG